MALQQYTFRHRPEVIARIKRDAKQLGVDHTVHTRNLLDASLTRDDGRELHLLRLAVQNLTAHVEALAAQQEKFYPCFIEGVEDMLINQVLPLADRLRVSFVQEKIKDLCHRLGVPYRQSPER